MEKMELRNEEVRDILTRIPGSIVSQGIAVIAAIWIFILIGSYFFRYPETVTAETVITTENPPVWLTSKVNGTIQELNVRHLQKVSKGQILAVLENPANTHDLLDLRNTLSNKQFSNLDYVINHPLLIERALSLGELQTAWSEAVRLYSDYITFLEIDSYKAKVSALTEKQKVCTDCIATLKRKEANQKLVCAMIEERFKREKRLYQKGVISQNDFQESEELILTSKQALEEIRYDIQSTQMESVNLKQNRIEIETEHRQSLNDFHHKYQLAVNELSASFQSWEQKYLLSSPADGVVSFTENRNVHDPINAGDKIFAIVSGTTGKLTGHLKFSSTGSARVHPGQTLQIHLDGYPYLEYGALPGIIQSTSLLSNTEHLYSAIFSLPSGLRTGYGKPVEFRGELTGTAEIQTENLRLIERILNPIRYLMNQQKIR
jgi:multidrug resistance efflux pump